MAKKVLIIDDDVDVRTFVSSVVEDIGYKPELAKDGEEGIGKVKKEKPDLVVLDILMPKESGIKMYRALKTDSQFSDIPVIMHSGIAKRTFLRSQKALDEFGDQPVPEPEAYLEKPIEPEDLGETIKKFLS